jgi:hypothetical protein
MAYGLYLSLDQDRWFRNDFSSENKLTGTVYTDVNQVTAKDLTGYTVKIKLYRENSIGERFSQTASIVVAANGTWSYAVGISELPPQGLYRAKVELTKAGVQESTLNKVEFHILRGPAD